MGKRLIVFLILSFWSINMNCYSQPALAEGFSVQTLPIKKLLNDTSSITSFNKLGDKLVVLDFFGTWCAPCLRALPHLSEVKQQFKSDLKVVLVSNETEAQLTKFIKARKDFPFPIIVDEDNTWNNRFHPPSLPYTVVIKHGKVIAITKAEDITNAAIERWLHDTQAAAVINTETTGNMSTMNANKKSSNAILQLSQDYIYTAKTGGSLEDISSKLRQLNYTTLVNTLSTDNFKKAFWINLYNGYVQSTLKSNPDKYKNRNAFFKKKQVEVAGIELSLDEIEHGILRHSKNKWSLGYFNKLFPSKREKELRVANVDYRIHFTLNCGAKSCPPIAFYNPDILDKQLDIATKAYLSGEAFYDSSTNILSLPKLMSWFRADFGGKKGMIAILKKLELLPEDVHPAIKFKKYDWSLTLNNYTNYE